MNPKKKYNRKFEKYLHDEFQPAQICAASEKGREYICNAIPSLEALRAKENDVLAAVYEIMINNKSVYIGQSLRTIRRLYTHAHHLFTDPVTYFGIRKDEIESVEFKLCNPPILDEDLRLSAEEALIRKNRPTLQPYHNTPGMRPDACLPRGMARRTAMIQAGAIK